MNAPDHQYEDDSLTDKNAKAHDNIVEIKDDEEFERALAAYNGGGNKDYMRVTRKRILDADRAYDLISDASEHLTKALNLIADANYGTTRTRALSLAITKVEEAMLWLGTVAYGVAPHNMDATTPYDDLIEKMNKNLNAQS